MIQGTNRDHTGIKLKGSLNFRSTLTVVAFAKEEMLDCFD